MIHIKKKWVLPPDPDPNGGKLGPGSGSLHNDTKHCVTRAPPSQPRSRSSTFGWSTLTTRRRRTWARTSSSPSSSGSRPRSLCPATWRSTMTGRRRSRWPSAISVSGTVLCVMIKKYMLHVWSRSLNFLSNLCPDPGLCYQFRKKNLCSQSYTNCPIFTCVDPDPYLFGILTRIQKGL